MKIKMKYFYLGLLIFVVSLNLRFAITSVSPILDNIQASLQMNNIVASLLTSIPVICTGLFAPLLNTKFIQKREPAQTLLVMLIFITLGTTARFFVSNILSMVLSTMLIGIGMTLASPIISGMIKRYFPNHTSLMVSLYSVALAAGASLGSAFTLTLLESFYNSWNIALGFWSIFGMIAIILLLPLVIVLTRKAKNTPQAKVEAIKLASPWKSSKGWSMALFFGLQSGLYYALIAWYIPFLKSIGVDAKEAAYILTSFTAIQMLGNFLFPFLVSIFQRKIQFIYLSATLTLVGMFALIYGHLSYPSVIFFALGTGGLFSLGILMPIDASKNAVEASEYSAMVLSVGYILGGIIPIILGWIIDLINNISLSMNILILFNLLIFIVIYWMNKELAKD